MEDLPRVEGPPSSDVIFNDGCHVLRRPVTSGVTVLLLLPVSALSLSFPLVLPVCMEQR